MLGPSDRVIFVDYVLISCSFINAFSDPPELYNITSIIDIYTHEIRKKSELGRMVYVKLKVERR